jgi:hypothetical protein
MNEQDTDEVKAVNEERKAWAKDLEARQADQSTIANLKSRIEQLLSVLVHIQSPDTSVNEKALLAHITHRSNHDSIYGDDLRGVKDLDVIAKETGICRDDIFETVQSLVKKGLVHMEWEMSSQWVLKPETTPEKAAPPHTHNLMPSVEHDLAQIAHDAAPKYGQTSSMVRRLIEANDCAFIPDPVYPHPDWMEDMGDQRREVKDYHLFASTNGLWAVWFKHPILLGHVKGSNHEERVEAAMLAADHALEQILNAGPPHRMSHNYLSMIAIANEALHAAGAIQSEAIKRIDIAVECAAVMLRATAYRASGAEDEAAWHERLATLKDKSSDAIDFIQRVMDKIK